MINPSGRGVLRDVLMQFMRQMQWFRLMVCCCSYGTLMLQGRMQPCHATVRSSFLCRQWGSCSLAMTLPKIAIGAEFMQQLHSGADNVDWCAAAHPVR